MSEPTSLEFDEVVCGSQYNENPIGPRVLDEPYSQLLMRQSSRPLNGGEELDASQISLADSVETVDDDNTSGSWQHVPRLDADVRGETNTQEARQNPRIFGRYPSYDDFYAAVKRGDTSAVTTMLNDGANIERQNDGGASPLVIAIYASQIDMISLLLGRGADVHYPIIDSPPVYHAVMQGARAPEIIELLLTHGAELDVIVGPTNLTPLHWAAMMGMDHAASFLIALGLDKEMRCLRGKTPLVLAAEKGHTTVVRLLLARGADMHARSGNGGTALTWAASNGHAEIVEYLLEQGLGVDDCDEDGTTALAIASMSGHLAVVKILLENDANANALSIRPKDCTAAMGAANAGHTEVLRTLISHGADLAVIPGDGVTALEGAIRKGHLDTVKILLKAVGGPGYPTESVALQMALARSQPTMRSLMTTVSLMYLQIETRSSEFAWMQWVLDQGGELVRPRALHNMLQATLFDGKVSMVEELFKLGADANYPVFTGDRPLHVAVGLRNKDLVRVLLHAGADPALPSGDGKTAKLTPFHQALIFLDDDAGKDTLIVDMLLASGRCKLMEGEDPRSTALSFIVRRFDHWENGLAETIAERMLDSISDVNGDRSDDGSTLMHVAVYYQKSHLVDILLAKGADINAKNKSGYTPFLLAHQSKRHFLDFLDCHGADPFAVNANGQGVLHLAAIHGHGKVIDSLLVMDWVEGKQFDVDAVDYLGHTALISAIAAGKEEAALRLLYYGAKFTTQTTDKGRIALHYAARAGMPTVVEKLLADSASINVQDSKGWTPLALTCTASSPATLIRFLLAQGADPEIPNHAGDRPLHIALKRPWHSGPADRRWGDPSLELINYGVNITAADAEGRRPLHLAAQFHNLSATRLLLAKDASLREVDGKGQTPLSVCSKPEIAEALTEAGADVNHVEENGYTPLHHAVDRCWVRAFQVLVKAGADVHAKIGENGSSVQERIEKAGGWREWAMGHHEAVCQDADREDERVAEMEREL